MSFDLQITDGDLKVSKNGDIKRVNGTDKLIQDILKIITTPLGGNVFYPWYGSPVTKTLIGNALDTKFLFEMSRGQISTALEKLQELQKYQSQSSQRTDATELIGAIQSIKLERNQVDPRYFRIVISVLNKAFASVSTGIDITL